MGPDRRFRQRPPCSGRRSATWRPVARLEQVHGAQHHAREHGEVSMITVSMLETHEVRDQEQCHLHGVHDVHRLAVLEAEP